MPRDHARIEPIPAGVMSERLRQRLRKDRPMTTVNLSIPQDVLDELEEVATRLGFSDYQSLMRAYIGRGLRADAPEPAQLKEKP